MRYYSVNNYLKETYGGKLYKLALKSGTTCPNRDGTIGSKGCIFCCEGSGHFAEPISMSVHEQIENAKLKIINKTASCSGFIAYFQDYTATYAPIEYLKMRFNEAVNHPDVRILSVATRPDCLSEEVLNLLSELNKIKPVWVELGFQTCHETTADYIRRGYKNEVFDLAVKNLKNVGVYVISHIIIGLPGETEEMIYETVNYVSNLHVDGIKYHLLHVLKNTDLEKEYKNGKFNTLTLEKYCEILSGCIMRTDKNIAIHRLTGDGQKTGLVSPLWSTDKKIVLNTINKYFDENNIIQGELLKENP